MALLDISDVTRSLVALIREAFVVSPAWTIAPPSVLPEPPSRLTGEGMGFYLYHVQENKSYANFPIPGRDDPPVRFLPMGLNFYYQLSANSTMDDGTGAYNEQLMMGIAMKVLHDYPVINDSTQINGLPVFVPSIRGRDNRFKIMFQAIPYNEAVNNWTAGAAPIRISAYYEVSVVFLEPEEALSYAGRVLTFGTFVFTEGSPAITATQNIISFNIPGQASASQVKLQPAQAAPSNDMQIFGNGFSGDIVDLLLLNAAWPEPALAFPGWNLTQIAINQLVVTIQEKATVESTGVLIDVLPGMYAAQVVVTRNLRLPNGDIKKFKHLSNQFPFIVSPAITSITLPPLSDVVTVKAYSFQNPDKTDVYIGDQRITKDGGAFNPGAYRITAIDTMEIRLPAGLNPGQILPLRIIISGAESPPRWITIP